VPLIGNIITERTCDTYINFTYLLEKDALTVNVSNAPNCGFSKSTADSLEAFAPLLGLR
jgi:hypothetical protein